MISPNIHYEALAKIEKLEATVAGLEGQHRADIELRKAVDRVLMCRSGPRISPTHKLLDDLEYAYEQLDEDKEKPAHVNRHVQVRGVQNTRVFFPNKSQCPLDEFRACRLGNGKSGCKWFVAQVGDYMIECSHGKEEESE